MKKFEARFGGFQPRAETNPERGFGILGGHIDTPPTPKRPPKWGGDVKRKQELKKKSPISS